MDNKQGQVSGYLAMVVGALLAAAETRLNWDDWEDWQGWLWWGYFFLGYLPAVLLFVGGFRTMYKMKGGLRMLCCGWGFTAALSWVSFLRTFEDGADASHYADSLPPLAIAILLGLLMVIALFGMWRTVTHQE